MAGVACMHSRHRGIGRITSQRTSGAASIERTGGRLTIGIWLELARWLTLLIVRDVAFVGKWIVLRKQWLLRLGFGVLLRILVLLPVIPHVLRVDSWKRPRMCQRTGGPGTLESACSLLCHQTRRTQPACWRTARGIMNRSHTNTVALFSRTIDPVDHCRRQAAFERLWLA